MWENDTIWVGYEMHLDHLERAAPPILEIALRREARTLGRETGKGVLLLFSFETEDDRHQFLEEMKEQGLRPRRIEPTRFDIENAKPIGQVFPFSLDPVGEEITGKVVDMLTKSDNLV
jgi:hypothetical protein